MGTERVKKRGSLSFRNITKKYGNLTVVDEVSLDIQPGEFFSLLGPSGSGKTTTLMMLAGFAQPDVGQILLDGKDISQLSPQQRNLGMVFQNYALFPHMSVLDNVMFPLRVRKYSNKECRERAQWAIDLVRLSTFAKRLPKELSGGQQQRVALARAVVFHPEVVLMDEPLGALDKNLRYQMQMEIKDLQRQLDMTVVFVTHDQEEAMNMSDRIAIMNNGKIEQMGSPKEVYESPRNMFAASFLGEANILPYQDLDLKTRDAIKMKPEDVLFIRPERVTLSAILEGQHAGEPGLTGTISSSSFLGHILRYQVKLSDATTVYADATNLSDATQYVTGQPVRIGWDHDSDIRVLRHD